MAKKARLKKENETIYPLTIPEAVKDPQTNRHIGEIYATKNALADKENKKVFKEVELDNYTLTNSDVNNFLVFNSNNPITLYVPESLDKSIVFEGVQNGDGKITFSGVGLIEIESPDSSLETGGKDDVFKLTKKSENKYVLQKRNFASGETSSVYSVNGYIGDVILDADDIDDAETTNKFTSQSDIDRLANTSGTNTGDENTTSIQSKRPIKTIEGQSLEGSGNIDLNKSDVGLANVNNTSDIDKPISTATQNALDDKVDAEAGKGLSEEDYTSIEKTKLSNIEEEAQKNVQSDWEEIDSQKNSFIKRKPDQTNFNIYNQNKTDKITVSSTTKTSIIAATTGNLNLPSYNQNDSFIGRLFGKYTNAASGETITLDFTIGNRTYSTQIDHDSDLQNSYVPFYLDYVINFPEYRRASFEGVVVVGNQSYLIDLDPNYLLPNVITGLLFNIEVTLSGGELISNSSYLHRNYN